MKFLIILILSIESVYSQFGIFDSFKILRAYEPFFREASKINANSYFPRSSGLSSLNPASGCNVCSLSANDLNWFRYAQQLSKETNFPNIPTNVEIPNIQQIQNFAPTEFSAFIPSTPAPLERRPSFKYPEIKNSLNSANSRLKSIGGPKGGGLDLLYRVGK
ncbi:hypothetical protein ACKWTF_004522 [Chironomus riparius]